MAARFSAVFIICFLCISSVSPRRDRISIKGIFRSRRQTCVDGTYDTRTGKCCLCPAGQRVMTECTSNPNDGKCEICEDGKTYNSEPNSRKTCQPCTSCEQPSANLEVDEVCTVVRNTKCRCKKGFFCSSNECTICQPCTTCGFGGIKEDCTPTNDTVCNGSTGAALGIVVVVVVLIAGAIVAAVYVRRQRKRPNKQSKDQSGSYVVIPNIDEFGPLLPDIANELGWRDMKNIAIRTPLPSGIIESCETADPEERTLQLLMKWVEKEGKEAPRTLIQTLEKMNKKGKAEKISDILSKANSASSNNSGNNN